MAWKICRKNSIRRERRTLLAWNFYAFPKDRELYCFWEELAEYFIIADECMQEEGVCRT